ncbi:LEA type 2 family protein [Pseudomonas akapageensis]|uniref:LEA type 2 family protein n=1 Tax=Pseudomonas akapageensis TaxID=2609961 RepID=UPI0014082231|nr:LEA type 2 family protein [Pseudomonas akapageensis]
MRCLMALMLASLGACSLLPQRDPVKVSVAGIEPLSGQDMELRMAVKLRVQNPNDTVIEYNGIAVDLEVNGRPLASGVSDQSGRIERFGEAVLVVPMSVSAFSVLRQGMRLGRTQSLDGLPYELHGKLAGGLFGTVRFSEEGTLDLPAQLK